MGLIKRCHPGIIVEDMEKSLCFYTNTLGMKLLTSAEIEGEEFEKLLNITGVKARSAILRVGESSGEIMELVNIAPVTTDSRSVEEGWSKGRVSITLGVDCLDAAYEKLREEGVDFYSTPQVLKIGKNQVKSVFFKDPNGALLEIAQILK